MIIREKVSKKVNNKRPKTKKKMEFLIKEYDFLNQRKYKKKILTKRKAAKRLGWGKLP
jgi:hypothetical protein